MQNHFNDILEELKARPYLTAISFSYNFFFLSFINQKIKKKSFRTSSFGLKKKKTMKPFFTELLTSNP